jgi:MFS family permease
MNSALRPFFARFEIPAAVASSLLVQTVNSLLAASIPILAPQIAVDSGWSVDLIMFYGPILYVAALGFNFQVPNILRHTGGMGLGLICVVLSVVGLLCLLPLSSVFAVVAPMWIGAANAGMNPASSQMLGPRTTSRTAGLIMAIKQTGVPLGGVLAGVLVPLFVLQWGWKGALFSFVIVGLMTVLFLFPTVRWLSGSAQKSQAFRPLEPAKRALALPGMKSFIMAAVTFGATQQYLRSFLTVYLVNSLGLSLTVAGLAFGASQAAGIVGQILWAVISDRVLSPHATMALLGTLMTVAGILTGVLTSHWPVAGIIAVTMLFGLTAAGFIPVVYGQVARLSPPGDVGAITSGTNIFILSGMLVGPLVFGAIASTFSYSTAFAALTICSLFGAIITARFALRETAQQCDGNSTIWPTSESKQ